jgi:hypothetical protein
VCPTARVSPSPPHRRGAWQCDQCSSHQPRATELNRRRSKGELERRKTSLLGESRILA